MVVVYNTSTSRMPFQIGGVFSSCSSSSEGKEWNSSKFFYLPTVDYVSSLVYEIPQVPPPPPPKKKRIRRLTAVEDFPNQVYFRRLYPVDMKRVNEFGVSYDDQEKEQDKPHKD